MPNPQKPARLWLRKRTDGSPAHWLILDGGKQYPTGCTALEIGAAEKALQDHIAARHRPNTRNHHLSQIPIADVLSMYLDTIPADSPSLATRTHHVAALERFWGDMMLSDVKGGTCRAYVEARPVKASTARQELKTLQAAINIWHKESPLEAVPQVTLPKPAPPRERVLSRGEVASMLRECRKVRKNKRVEAYHVTRIIRLGLATCTRPGAMFGLRWTPSTIGGWIDLDTGIMFRRGHRERDTSKRRPPVVLTPKALAMCRRWQAMDAANGINAVIHYRGLPISKLRRSWAAVIKSAGVEGVTPHTLKHTGVTWLVLGGMKLVDVARVSGTDMQTLERVYAHYEIAAKQRRAG